MSVLQGLAMNQGLSVNELEPLLEFAPPPSLIVLAGRGDVTRKVATVLARHTSADVRHAMAKNPLAIGWVWPLLANDSDVTVRVALAAGRTQDFRPPVNDLDLPIEAQRQLADDPAVDVRRALASRPRLAPDVGRSLAADDAVDVRRSLARQWRDIPADVARMLLQDRDFGVRRHALTRTIVPPDLVAGLLADPETRAAIAEVAALSDTALQALAADADDTVREAVARNPRLPAGLVTALVGDPDESVRTMIMLRGDVDDATRQRIADTVQPQDWHVADWLLPANASLATRRAHVQSSFAFCRRAVAFSTDLLDSDVAILANDADYSVRLLAAENNPDASCHDLPALIRVEGHARWELARRPTVPVSALVDFARSDDPMLRLAASLCPSLPPAVARLLATDGDYQTRLAAAANPALPTSELRRIIMGPDPTLAGAAASNPGLPIDLARALIAHVQRSHRPSGP